MYKGLVRIKCVDLANWAAMNDKLGDLPEGVRVSTEGMETLNLHPEASETLLGLQENLANAIAFGIERFGEQNEDMCTMLKMLKNDMVEGLMTKSYGVQFRYPNAPYIDIILKNTEETEE